MCFNLKGSKWPWLAPWKKKVTLGMGRLAFETGGTQRVDEWSIACIWRKETNRWSIQLNYDAAYIITHG